MTPPFPSETVRLAAAAWDVELLESVPSRYSDTWFARQGDRDVVIKGGDVDARRREAVALTAYSASPGAAVSLLAHRDGVLLLDRALPGG